MVLCNEKGFFLGDPNDMVCLRRVYRELFKNKAKLTGGRENPKGINASTIVKHIMNKKKVEIREQWFIEIKLQRGEFREYKLIAEFFQYKRILHEFREMLLATLLLPRDSIVVATMYTITQELLEIIKNNMID